MKMTIIKYVILVYLLAGFSEAFSQNSEKITVYKNQDTIKVGLPIVPGFMSKDKNGEPIGFAVELLSQAMDDEKILYKWIEGTWPELYKELLNGEIQILPSVQITNERRKQLDFLDFALSTMWSELFVNKHFDFNSITDLRGKKIGLIRNDNNANGFIEFIKDFQVEYVPVYFSGHSQALEALTAGEIDAMAGPPSNFMSEYSKDIKSCGLVYNPTSVSIAFSREAPPYLKKALNNRFNIYMSQKESVYANLYKKYNLDLNTNKFKFPFFLKVILFVFGITLLLGSMFIFLLKQQVSSKTAELLKAKNKAEESERLKTAFLANMSHEIRTPLNSILGFSEMLSEEDLAPEEKKQFAGIILRQNNILLRLINDIIEISKIEAGTVEIKKNHIKRIDPILSDIFDNFNANLPPNIVLKLNNELPGYITDLKIDVIRVKQILTNLLSNAFKYSKKGTVILGCKLTEKGQIKFWVSDEGQGISEEDLPKVFDRFRQLNVMSKGAGLGLAICNLLADLMDGEMDVVSEEGKGSTFSLTLNSYR